MAERVSSLDNSGNRQLQSSSDVFEHNAWDNAEMDNEMLQKAIKQISLQSPVENPEIYNQNPAGYWDKFYSLNQNKFFKDRNWLSLEFPELFQIPEGKSPFTICEIGCGAGNTCYPWLTINKDKNVFAYACDYSAEAIKVVKQNSMYDESRMKALVLDITTTEKLEIEESSVDVCVCIFVLSALHPSEWKQAVDNIYRILKPGILLLIERRTSIIKGLRTI
jgi:tRNAThr (cytosine32-N3)-methyltransferase